LTELALTLSSVHCGISYLYLPNKSSRSSRLPLWDREWPCCFAQACNSMAPAEPIGGRLLCMASTHSSTSVSGVSDEHPYPYCRQSAVT